MARIIKSIFNSNAILGDTEAKRRQALMGAAAGAQQQPYNQIGGAVAGLLGARVRQELFPTQAERGQRIEKEIYKQMALEEGVDFINKPFESNALLLKRVGEEAVRTENTQLIRSVAEATQELQAQAMDLKSKQQQAKLARQQYLNAVSQGDITKINLAKATRDQALEERGLLNRGEQITYLEKVRSDFKEQFDDVRKGAATFKRLLSMPNTGSGDFQLISGFIKLVDDSIITGEEFALAAGSAGKAQEILNYFKSFTEGDVLNDKARALIKQTAGYLYRMKQEAYGENYNENFKMALSVMTDDSSSPDEIAKAENLIQAYIGDSESYVVPDSFFQEAAKVIIKQGQFEGKQINALYDYFDVPLPNNGNDRPSPAPTPDPTPTDSELSALTNQDNIDILNTPMSTDNKANDDDDKDEDKL